MTPVEVYGSKPEGFVPQMEVAACYVEAGERFLLMQLSSKKAEAGRWGVPAGKVELGEEPHEAARRELWEETALHVEFPLQEGALAPLYIRNGGVEYVYHPFRVPLPCLPEITLSGEHREYRWVYFREARELPLMAGGREALDHYIIQGSRKERFKAAICVYLLLRRGDELLLHLRKNTGYCDGWWGLVAGHVEEGESATGGMIREAFEEAGIRLASGDLQVVQVVHRVMNRVNVDFFFACDCWEGEVENREPEKCGGLAFFPLEGLPNNTIGYVRDVLDGIAKGGFYMEQGWGAD